MPRRIVRQHRDRPVAGMQPPEKPVPRLPGRPPGHSFPHHAQSMPLSPAAPRAAERKSLTDRQERCIRAQIASGEYGNDSEYVRDLIRRDQEQNA